MSEGFADQGRRVADELVLPRQERVGPAGSKQPGVSPLGGVASLLVLAVLLGSLSSFFVHRPGLGLRTWLIVLFDLNAGMGGLPAHPLRARNPLDFVVLLLVGVAFLTLGPGLRKVSKTWATIAVALPFAGIIVLAVTGQPGRSAVMGAGLVIAFLMLKGKGFSRTMAVTGLVANALLLAADVATTGTRAPLVAGVVGLGYVLLMAWFLMIGLRLLGRTGNGSA